MQQQHYFQNAQWVSAVKTKRNLAYVLRGHFFVEEGQQVNLNILGLGFFKCYINGVCINSDTFLPLSSEYEAKKEPVGEVFSGHRTYVPHFDITAYVHPGDNVIAIHYGGGWYTCKIRSYGYPKAIYCITATGGSGEKTFVSDENCKVGRGYLSDYFLLRREEHDYNNYPDCLEEDFDDSAWEQAVPAIPLETEYCTTDCPADGLIRTLPVRKVAEREEGTVYDCGENTVGYPVLRLKAAKGETVVVTFSEELAADGGLDPTHVHYQSFTVTSDGKERIVQPEFIWYGFRAFSIKGNAEPECVKVVHAKVPVSSGFTCDNPVLNWAYETFLHTMLCNMHTGHPSDCPHLERRGYTGDGQLTCHAVLTAMDAVSFYEKWLQDIADGQDTITGHVQYAAPYINSGGGPGGWGCAIVEVPYQIYRHTGDEEILKKYYGNMRRYIDYLEAHSKFGLVVSDREGCWCLGDWCGPNILYPDRDITFSDQQVMLPAPMVNTYFMVKSLQQMCKIARVIGKEEDIAGYEAKIQERKDAITAAYFNTFDGNFVMNVQGANAYAVDLGLGDKRTYANMVGYYKKLGHFDTGIFATDILTRVLFQNGDGDLAVKLLTSNGPQGYAHWMENGATTFHEYWDSNRSRSHNHPMFGAPVAYFFEYLLGIRQQADTVGYTDLVIAPQGVDAFGSMSGSIRIPAGEVKVGYIRTEEKTEFTVVIPEGVKAVFRYADTEKNLLPGEQTITY